MYGMHPILFTGLKGAKWAAIFINNVNAHDWALLETGSSHLPLLSRFISTGGIVDLYVILGERIEQVVQTYHQIIGRPVLIPFYALGFNQCRWGYNSQQMLNAVLNRAIDTQFPMEVLWSDIDYMDRYLDFTIDQSRYPNLTDFVLNTLRPRGVHFVPILDVGIGSTPDNNPVYSEGITRQAFFKSGYTNQTLIGKVWPGSAAFVNLLPNTTGAQFWKDQIQALYARVPYSGLWHDMEEVSNFCDGECPEQMDFTVLDPVEMFSLKWVPGRRSLNVRSLSHNAYAVDSKGQKILEFDLHSLHGFLQSYATSEVLTERLKMRPFIISRSTAMGGGRWSSHWLGDNYAKWEFLGISITEIMYFNMYGYPLVGADICGHIGDASYELCGRWMQLGAFYPFMRAHKNKDFSFQEPWSLDQEHLRISKSATLLRLSLLRFIYSAYFKVHQEGGTLFSPLFFHWEDHSLLYQFPEKSFILGDALMVHPVLEQGMSSIEIYFPQSGAWVNLVSNSSLLLAEPQQRAFAVDRRSLFVYLVPGRIIPIQQLENNTTQTSQLSQIKTSLVIALDGSNQARGRVVFDDGVSLLKKGHYWQISMSFSNLTLSFEIIEGRSFSYPGKDGLLREVKIFGLEQDASTAFLSFHDDREKLQLNVQENWDGSKVVEVPQRMDVSFREIQNIKIEH